KNMEKTMIIDLPNTTTSQISKVLVAQREESGATALGRVLTLIVDVAQDDLERVIEAATEASREHPMRVITIARPEQTVQKDSLDAQLRIGGDAGASEVVVLRPSGEANGHDEALVTGLLLPDAPVVSWWSGSAPADV